MKVTNFGAVILTMIVTSGLLLFAAASCSVKPKTSEAADESPVVGSDAHEHDVDEGSHDDHAGQEKESVTLNKFCHACHADFGEDKLARKHEQAGIGCERCHGESERHRSDEDNITPPEMMYSRARINPTCMMCHPRPTIEHVNRHDVILAGAETIFDEPADSAAEDRKVCTDCHGRGHRMNVRTIRWNKATGELLE